MELYQCLFPFLCLLYIVVGESKLVVRRRRFILQDDPQTTRFPFPVPTTYPIPTLPGANVNRPTTKALDRAPALGALASGLSPSPAVLSNIVDSAQVSCPTKRSADHIRVVLDDDMMQALYQHLVGPVDTSVAAATYEEAMTNFRMPTHHKHNSTMTSASHTKQFTTGLVKKDIKSLEAWYTAVTKTNQTLHNVHDRTSDLKQHILDLIEKLGITVTDVKHMLGLNHEVEDILKFYTKKPDRIRRATTGIMSRVEYCHERGTSTGTGYLHMCATCALTTQLSDDTYPRYINEADCDGSDCDCFTTNGSPNGQCQPVYQSVKMLRRKSQGCRVLIQDGQQYYMDNWTLYDQRIRVGCECVFNKNSLYAAFIPRI